jgi:hypothetical protein
MQCILYKIYFWKLFHMNYNLICIFICTPICTKKIILAKSGCYKRKKTDAAEAHTAQLVKVEEKVVNETEDYTDYCWDV